jgi:hypothetical protein
MIEKRKQLCAMLENFESGRWQSYEGNWQNITAKQIASLKRRIGLIDKKLRR